MIYTKPNANFQSQENGLGGISVSELSKSYGRDSSVLALKNFRLEFPEGQCTVLLGPSGCGKTTVLRSIAGLIKPDAGRIIIGDSLVFDAAKGTDLPPEKRHLGMVFQSYALWPHLTISGNVSYPLLSSNLNKKEIATKTEAMLEWIGLSGMGGRYVHEISGGQQQRVSLGRAMIGNPRAILFDEPLSNLDARLRERMRMELLSLRQKAPYTAIYVTHDQLEAMTLGDRVVVMREGQIEQTGSPEDIYRRPRTRFVADFVGIPNLLSGVIHSVSGTEILVNTLVGILNSVSNRSNWAVGDSCTLAIRPTLLELTHANLGSDHKTVKVIRSIFQGTSNLDFVELNGTQIVVESFSEQKRKTGETLNLKPVSGAVFALLDD